MLKAVISRRWLTALTVATVFALACVFLGRWQWHRHEEKAARAERIERHYSASPIPLSAAMPSPRVTLPQASEWTLVTATGRYDGQDVMLVRNRPNNGVYGYEVVVPLRLAGGTSLLVDRGWIPNGRTAAQPSRTPRTPVGDITVTGWLRLGEPSLGRRMSNGQLASVNLAEAKAQAQAQAQSQAQVDAQPQSAWYGAYLIRRSEVGSPGLSIEHPDALEAPDTGQGPHLAYAFQWWLTAPVGLVLVFVGARREYAEGSDLVGVGAPVSVAKVKKTRIWDEEDE